MPLEVEMNHTTLRDEIEGLLGTVDDVMQQSVLTLRPDLSIGQAAKELEHGGVSGAPVVLEGRVVGVVTLRDLFEAADVPFAKAATSGAWHRYEAALDRSGLTVERAMTASAVTLAAGTPIPEAVAMMRGRRINRIPIVDGDGRVRGIVARDDIIEAVARAFVGLRREDLESECPKMQPD
jgi:CBS domain-containing protein